MAKVRKDLRGRSLRKGEVQRSSDKRYMYTYTDPMGRRKFIYANDLTELREKEAKLMKDQLDGLDLYVAGKASVNDTFDRYMSTKYNLRESTRSSYFYTYDHYVRDTFGNKRIAEIKYSDVLQFYYYLLNEVKISLGTLDTVHCLLHPTFQLAVRDEIIRNNPTDGVMKEISRESGKNRGIRHALTVEQQRAFMEYIANHPIYYHWWPMFTVLLGTGCRIGEALGLRWQDLDYDRRTISINHSLSYYQKPESNKSVLRISKPKTEAGIRTIPMLDVVKDSFEMLYEEQLENGESRVVLKLPAALAPVKLAVMPLVKKDGLPEKAREVIDSLKFHFHCQYDEKDSIGKRYRRQDAIGTPYCVTVDHQTLEDNCVTLRNRDTMQQERVAISELNNIIADRVSITSLLKTLQ